VGSVGDSEGASQGQERRPLGAPASAHGLQDAPLKPGGQPPGVAGDAEAELAAEALARYSTDPSLRLEFVRHGENTTYRVPRPEGDWALRLARPGYQSVEAIRSEIRWMHDLNETGVATPAVVHGRDGDIVQLVPHRDGGVRAAVAFTWIEGRPLPEVDSLGAWKRLGAIMARIHEHGRRWRKPRGFVRPAWDVEALVGDSPRWGNPFPEDVWSEEDTRLLQAVREAVRERLHALGKDDHRFGLIHADLGFENVLVQPDGSTVVIDFDDSGPSWYLYELASALYPFEGESGFVERTEALVAGYRSIRSLPDEDARELPTLLMARRLATLGWTFTRGETAHAQRQRARRIRSSPSAARRFLDWHAAAG
jgi:Ser/Thr protein kinase RdoA (MazF antagonist)